LRRFWSRQMKIGYARVSTQDQRLNLQLEALHNWVTEMVRRLIFTAGCLILLADHFRRLTTCRFVPLASISGRPPFTW
jgi:predicted site-specific integrase-resolvase